MTTPSDFTQSSQAGGSAAAPSLPVASPGQPLASYVLQFFAVMVAVLTVIVVFVALAEVSAHQERATVMQIVGVGALLVGGLAITAMLVGASVVLRHLYQVSQTLSQLRQAAVEPDPAVAHRRAVEEASARMERMTAEHLVALRSLLEDVRENVLLTDEERRTKRQRLVALERRDRTLSIQKALEAGQFQRARQLLLEMERRLGGDETTQQLAEHIEEVAGQAEAEDVAAATRQCEDLMSLTSWDRAVAVANDLIDRHPNALPAKQLLARVQRERQVHEQEHRNRLHLEIQRHTSRREWRKALEAANQLIAAYPDSIEAEALRAQMETLTSNAEIEHRKHLEDQYKLLCEGRQFAEALALAREVVDRYPASPQAKVMRSQIPQLEKKAGLVSA